MKAAIIGGGFAGRVHVGALRAVGVEPALVITTKEETAKQFAQEMRIPRWSGAENDGYTAAFAPEIDAVHVCTPPAFHAAITKELLRHGKNVLCEKPIALDPEEARDLLEAEQEACLEFGRKPLCALTFNVRFHQACQRAKELICSGKFGRPILIHGNYLQEFHALPAPYDWRYDPDIGGKMRAITEIGSHWIDLAQYISGKKVTAVSALTANFWPERDLSENAVMTAPKAASTGAPQGGAAPKAASADAPRGMTAPKTDFADAPRGGAVSEQNGGTGDLAEQKSAVRVVSEDAAAVNLKFEDGAVGSVLLSEVSPGRGNRLTLEVTCENGNLWWNEEDNNILYTAQKGDGIRQEIFAFGNGFADTFEELLRRFYAALGSGAEDLPTFEDGLQVALVCSAIGKSAEEGGIWVEP